MGNGLFVGKAPYGYSNRRDNGRSVVVVDRVRAAVVRGVFELYAFHTHTFDSLATKLHWETAERLVRSKLHAPLRDRVYVGEMKYRDGWHPGSHPPLVDSDTFERVQLLFGEKTYNARDSVFGAGMIRCCRCGKPIVVEIRQKGTASGLRAYHYYRCAAYNKAGHSRVRIKAADFDAHVLALVGRMRIADEKVRTWIANVLRAKAKTAEQTADAEREAIEGGLAAVRKQKQRLLDLRLLDEIETDTFSAKQIELRTKETRLLTKLEGCGRPQSERGDLAVKVFELSQALESKWLDADIAQKRLLLEIIGLNWMLVGATLVPEMRKPFDQLVNGLFVSSSRGDRTPIELFLTGVASWEPYVERLLIAA